MLIASRAAKLNGVAGLVVDSGVRDLEEIVDRAESLARDDASAIEDLLSFSQVPDTRLRER